MMHTGSRLARLQQIASTLADHALQPVAKARRDIQRIEAQISAINAHRNELYSSIGDPSVAGPMLAQANRLRSKQAALLTELAAAHVALDKARYDAKTAVGRDHALTALVTQKEAAARLEASRRLLR